MGSRVHQRASKACKGAWGWACGRLAGWWGKGSPRLRSVAGLRGRSATLGLRTAKTPTGGSSEEFSARGLTLTEQPRGPEEGFRTVHRFTWGQARTASKREAPRHYMIASTVIHRVRR